MLFDKVVAVRSCISLWTARINLDAFAGLAAPFPSTLRTCVRGIYLHEFGAVSVTVATLGIDYYSLATSATFFVYFASYTMIVTSIRGILSYQLSAVRIYVALWKKTKVNMKR